MPLNEQGNLSYRDFIERGGGYIAGRLGFDPAKYADYFSGYHNVRPELNYIQSGFESALGNAQSQGAQNMFELATKARGFEGQSGFSNFGAIQKSLGQTQGALQDIMRKNIAQQQLSKEQQVYGVQKSFFERALDTAAQLLQSGAEADFDDWNDSSGGPGGPVNYSGLSTNEAQDADATFNKRANRGTNINTGGVEMSNYLRQKLEDGVISQREYDWLWRQIYSNEWGENDLGKIDYIIQEMGGENFNYQNYGG